MLLTKAFSIMALLVVEVIGFDTRVPLGVYATPMMCEQVKRVYQRSNKDVSRFNFHCILIKEV